MIVRLILTVCVLLLSVAPSRAATRPNVIVFAVDDLCDWVGAMGYTQAKTPNIDALAAGGVVFNNAHCPGTFCAPSRSAIFTGRFASTSGCYTNEVYFYEHPEYRPMQVNFAKGGYETYGAGKLFHHPAGYIDQRGWKEFFHRNEDAKQKGWPLDSWGQGTPIPQPFPNSIYNRGRKITGGLFLEWGKVPNDKEEEMADTIRVNWACDVLKKKHDKPFFLAVGIYAPHFPNYAPAKYFDLYDAAKIKAPAYKDDDLLDLPPKIMRNKTNRKRLHHERLVKLGAVEQAIHGYLASISYADAMLGRLMKTLAQSPHAENTIVVLWSDHGYHHGEKGDWGKHTLWERTSNVPFIWAGPGVAKGKKVDASVSLIDMYPTFINMCKLPSVDGLEGASLANTLKNPAQAKDRDVYLPGLVPGSYAIMNKRWRYIHYNDDTEELYDVQADPHEWQNLAGESKLVDVKRKLRASAPKSFAPAGTPKPRLKLIVEGQSYRWEPKGKKR
jgi:arylsulfatase A-like enzyme